MGETIELVCFQQVGNGYLNPVSSCGENWTIPFSYKARDELNWHFSVSAQFIEKDITSPPSFFPHSFILLMYFCFLPNLISILYNDNVIVKGFNAELLLRSFKMEFYIITFQHYAET